MWISNRELRNTITDSRTSTKHSTIAYIRSECWRGGVRNKNCGSVKNYDDGKNIQLKAYNREELFEILQLQSTNQLAIWIKPNKAKPSLLELMKLMFTQITIIIITNDKIHKHKKKDIWLLQFSTICHGVFEMCDGPGGFQSSFACIYRNLLHSHNIK